MAGARARSWSAESASSKSDAPPLAGHAYFPLDAARTNLTTGPMDVSGNGRHMSLGAGITAAEANANAGYATTKAVVNGHLSTQLQASWATDLIVMAFVINMAAPAALAFLAGSNDYVTTECGLSFGVAADGKLRVFVAGNDSGTGNITAGAGLAYIAGSQVVVADGTDHKVGVAYDYRRRALYVWVDGVLVLSKQNALATGSGGWTRQFVWGTNKPGTACQLLKLKHINIYAKSGATLPANINSVMSAFATTPQNIWPLFDQTTRDVSLWPAGQSNQMGYGGTANAINTGVGAPLQDPLYPNGVSGKRSMYPSCANALGAYGFKLNVYNYAVGSSGLVENWVGQIQSWANNGLIKMGGYRAYGGRVYKAALSSGINGMPNCTTPPTNGGIDGTITWTDVGPDTGYRGAVPFGSPYFDPNGYIAQLAKYTNDLVPAIQDALASFSGDKRVFAGLNKFAAFGPLATSPASGVGFIADGLHGNDAAYDAAGVALANVMLPQIQSLG